MTTPRTPLPSPIPGAAMASWVAFATFAFAAYLHYLLWLVWIGIARFDVADLRFYLWLYLGLAVLFCVTGAAVALVFVLASMSDVETMRLAASHRRHLRRPRSNRSRTAGHLQSGARSRRR